MFRGRDLERVRRYADRTALQAQLGVLQRKYEQLQDRYEIQGAEVVQLREENRTLCQRWKEALERVAYLAQQLYGEKSERQQSLAAAVLEDTRKPGSETEEAPREEADQEPSNEQESAAKTEEVAPTRRVRGQQPGQPGHGRQRHPQLPTRLEYRTLPDAAQRCPHCGQWAQPCGTEESEMLHWVSQIERILVKRQRYRWTCTCPHDQDPQPTRLTDGLTGEEGVESLSPGVEESEIESLGPGVEESEIESLSPGVEESEIESLGSAIEESEIESLGSAVEEPKVESLSPSIEESKVESLGSVIEESKVESLGPGIEESKVESLSPGIEESKVESLGSAVEESEVESLGSFSDAPSPNSSDAEDERPRDPSATSADPRDGEPGPRAAPAKQASRSFTAPGLPKVTPHGMFTIGLLVQVLAWKYIWGIPLHRLRKQWALQGAAISAGTLVGALQALVLKFEPLYEALKAINREEEWWHADETHWKVWVDQTGKVGYRWWLWVFRGPRSTVFLLSPTRSAKVPKEHLQAVTHEGWPLWWDKPLITDFFSSYRAMKAGIIHAWCWAHIRRRFADVLRLIPEQREWAQAWIERIATLYQLHGQRQDAVKDSEDWQATDQALRAWATATEGVWKQELTQGLPSRGQEILATVQRQWEGLTVFLDHPEVPLDNNEAERLLRTPVVGRKNYYGSRAEWSGQLGAMMWTFWATADQMGRHPIEYLTDYLTAYAENGNQPLGPKALAAFLPPPVVQPNDTETVSG